MELRRYSPRVESARAKARACGARAPEGALPPSLPLPLPGRSVGSGGGRGGRSCGVPQRPSATPAARGRHDGLRRARQPVPARRWRRPRRPWRCSGGRRRPRRPRGAPRGGPSPPGARRPSRPGGRSSRAGRPRGPRAPPACAGVATPSRLRPRRLRLALRHWRWWRRRCWRRCGSRSRGAHWQAHSPSRKTRARVRARARARRFRDRARGGHHASAWHLTGRLARQLAAF